MIEQIPIPRLNELIRAVAFGYDPGSLTEAEQKSYDRMKVEQEENPDTVFSPIEE